MKGERRQDCGEGEGAACRHQGSRGSFQQGAANLDLTGIAINHAKRGGVACMEEIGTG